MLLFACSAPNTRQAEVNQNLVWASKKTRINNFSRWRAEGHATIITEQKSGNLNMDWRQDNDDFDVHLIAPFGQSVIHIQRQQNLTTLRRPGRPPKKSEDAENLLRQHIGWTLPVEKLPSWLKGLTNETSSFSLDPYGRLQSFQYLDWHIEYKSYQLAFGYELPKSIYLTSKELEIRLAIEQWHNTPTPKINSRRLMIPQ